MKFCVYGAAAIGGYLAVELALSGLYTPLGHPTDV